MNRSLRFVAPYSPPVTWQVAPEKWNQAMELYEQKAYRDSLLQLLDFASPGAREKYGNVEQTEFSLPHGSIFVHIQITDENLSIRAPFVGTEGAARIPLLRQVSELNFGPLNLARIVLEGDALHFTYSCPLTLCEPYVIYGVLQEVCMYADAYDDEFVGKFQAKRLNTPHIQPYSAAACESMVATIRQYLAQAEAYYPYFEQKREFGLCWYLLSITLIAVEQYAAPQGQIRGELNRAIAVLHRDTPYTERLQAGRRALRKLSERSDALWGEDFYQIATLIPYKEHSTPANLRHQLEESYQLARSRRDQGDHMGAYMAMSYIFLKLSHDYYLPEEVGTGLLDALVRASDQPWQDASGVLWDTLEQVMQPSMPPPSPGPLKSGWELLRSFFQRK